MLIRLSAVSESETLSHFNCNQSHLEEHRNGVSLAGLLFQTEAEVTNGVVKVDVLTLRSILVHRGYCL